MGSESQARPGASAEQMSSQAQALATDLLCHTREDLARADTKSNILFATIGVAAGVLLGAALSGDWTPADMPCVAEPAAWAACSDLLVALLLLGTAIFPRIGVRSADRVTFFGQVARLDDLRELRERLEDEAMHTATRDAEQLLVLSKIARRKYRLVQAALWVLLSSAVLGVAALLITAL